MIGATFVFAAPVLAQVPCGNGYCSPGQACLPNGLCGSPTQGSSNSGSLNVTLLQGWGDSIVFFVNYVLVPLLMAVAFIVFLYGVFKYFIWGADNEDSRKEGKSFVMYGVIGFVIIISLWGLVNVGVELLNLETGGRPSTLPYPTL